eukprot:399708-Pyramimonas_sp.AAC.1
MQLPLWFRGIFQHLGDPRPRPVCCGGAEVTRHNDDRAPSAIQGRIFLGGPACRRDVRELSRAGWGFQAQGACGN